MRNVLYIILTILSIYSVNGQSNVDTEKLYNVKLIDRNEDEFDTIVGLSYFKNDLFFFQEFNYPKLERINKDENSLLLIDKYISFEIICSKFDSSKANLKFSSEHNFLEKINNKEFWGTDGGIPTKEISNMVFWKDDSPINIPSKYYNDLFQPNIDCNGTYCYTNGYKTDQNEIIIVMSNSDGAGGYDVIFILDNNGNVIERVISLGF